MKKKQDNANKCEKNQWKYYNGALIPTCAPHVQINTDDILNNEIWKTFDKQKPYFARWTTDFDCGYETEWWYVIKDAPFDVSSLKAKRRYEINKGNKNFEVEPINPLNFKEEIFNVQLAAFSAYPEKYRPSLNKEKFIKSLEELSKDKYAVYGAFFNETKELCGYAFLTKHSDYMDFNVLKTNPKFEPYGLNAAIINKILLDFEKELNRGYYICDGARSISHETNFQNYLEKYFGFRKAYCKLNLRYNPKFRFVIKLCYAFRKIFYKLDKMGFVHKINGVLKMEEIVRKQKKNEK